MNSMKKQFIKISSFDFRLKKWFDNNTLNPLMTPPDKITIVTYNVWFKPYYFKERTEALLDAIYNCNPDIVCLQEVTSDHLEYILNKDWIKKGYFISDRTGETLNQYGLFFLSRLPLKKISLIDLPSQRKRKLLIAEIAFKNKPFIVATTHLESVKISSDYRARQLTKIFPLLNVYKDAILAGDFNFSSTQFDENLNIDEKYIDIWPLLRQDNPGYTKDSINNLMWKNIRAVTKQARYDRVLLRSSSWSPINISLIGTSPVSGDLPEVFPSDHFGIACTLKKQNNYILTLLNKFYRYLSHWHWC